MSVGTEQNQTPFVRRPAFTIHRFKQTITINLNPEMATELAEVLVQNEEGCEALGNEVPKFLFAFLTQLENALEQKVGDPPRQIKERYDEPRGTHQVLSETMSEY